ncbi:MAG: DUF4340 domain-containing protein [Thioalkalispiraceae bacterium]|jgi:hypothetical protein
MSSRNLLNLVLLITVLVLASIVVLEPGSSPQPANPRLTSLAQDSIEHVLIQRDNGQDIELQKTDGQWRMLKPYPLPANDFRMRSLLRLVEAESLSQHDLGNLERHKFGLDKPKAQVTFNHQSRILFGGNEPLQQHRYVQTGNTLHVINDTFYYQVAARETTFIDHALLPGQSPLSKLELPELVIELKDGKWQTTPENKNYSADAVTDLLNQWRTSQAIELKPVNKINTERTAKIYFKDQPQPRIFYIQQNEDESLLVRKDMMLGYVISRDKLENLLHLSAANDDKP